MGDVIHCNPAPSLGGWNPRNHGYKPPINWCRISQPSTVVYINVVVDISKKLPNLPTIPKQPSPQLTLAWCRGLEDEYPLNMGSLKRVNRSTSQLIWKLPTGSFTPQLCLLVYNPIQISLCAYHTYDSCYSQKNAPTERFRTGAYGYGPHPDPNGGSIHPVVDSWTAAKALSIGRRWASCHRWCHSSH